MNLQRKTQIVCKNQTSKSTLSTQGVGLIASESEHRRGNTGQTRARGTLDHSVNTLAPADRPMPHSPAAIVRCTVAARSVGPLNTVLLGHEGLFAGVVGPGPMFAAAH